MSKRKLALWHIGFWLLISPIWIIPTYTYARSAVPYWIISSLVYLSSFYVNLLLILPRWVKNRKIIFLLSGWLILIIIYSFFNLLLTIPFKVYQQGSMSVRAIDSLIRSCSFMGVLLFLGLIYRFTFDWFGNERVRRLLENQNLKTELSFLKSQINPHFLFNTLNNIYILAYQQSPRTADAVMKLSGMMQYILYECRNDLVLLSREINFIHQLIALQQLRMKDPIALSLSVCGEMESYSIPPMLLIPFVENVLKHGILNDAADPVSLKIEIRDQQLFFYSGNKINRNLKDDTGGIGMINVKRRLNLLYSNGYSFRIKHNESHYYIYLKIPLGKHE